MDYLIAKIKKEKENPYEKLWSGDNEVYTMPLDLDGAIPYEAGRELDDDEWFKIENFTEQEFCIDILKSEFRTTDYPEANKSKTSTIEFICDYRDNVYFFQKILRTSLLVQKRITLGDNISLDNGEKSIVINDVPDAIFVEESNVLYFKKLQRISAIFNGIEELYKEATKEETEGFVKNDFIQLGDGYEVDKIKTMNRKRIAMAMETLKSFNKRQRKEVLDYTHKYYPHLKYQSEKSIFTVDNEDEMKYLLWGIEQRYYTTPITKENRVANSVSKLES
jgi:hypothetical protein